MHLKERIYVRTYSIGSIRTYIHTPAYSRVKNQQQLATFVGAVGWKEVGRKINQELLGASQTANCAVMFKSEYCNRDVTEAWSAHAPNTESVRIRCSERTMETSPKSVSHFTSDTYKFTQIYSKCTIIIANTLRWSISLRLHGHIDCTSNKKPTNGTRAMED